MFRLVFLTFFGKPRYDEHKVHVHESPKNMTIPLIILAFLSIFGGWFAAPKLVGGIDYFEKFLSPVFAASAPAADAMSAAATDAAANPAMDLLHALTGWPVIVGVLGLARGLVVLHQEPGRSEAAGRRASTASTLLLLNKYYVDEIYAALIVRPLLWISTNVLWHVVDEGLIDGTVNGTATVARGSGGQARKMQSGNTRSYAAWVILGAVGFTALLFGMLGVAR